MEVRTSVITNSIEKILQFNNYNMTSDTDYSFYEHIALSPTKKNHLNDEMIKNDEMTFDKNILEKITNRLKGRKSRPVKSRPRKSRPRK